MTNGDIPRQGVVLVFVKRPVPGQVKTRLAKTMGAKSSCFIYSELLSRTISEISKVDNIQPWIVVSRQDDIPWFEKVCKPNGWNVSFQVEGDIGQRMLHSFERHLSSNTSVILVGSDVADFSHEDIEVGFSLLQEDGVSVIGPSTDGGYWMIGLNTLLPNIFEGIPWSSPSVFERTVKKIRKVGSEPRILPIRTDIDEVEDLVGLLLAS